MTKRLREVTVEDKGNRILVKPEIILEVAFDTIQKSDRHDSGFAIRFPKIKSIRFDKGLKDIDKLEKVKQIYKNQIYVKHKKIRRITKYYFLYCIPLLISNTILNFSMNSNRIYLYL